MKRKLISALLATAMVASMVVVPVMADEETEAATEATTEATTEAATEVTTEAAAAEEETEPVANPDLADKKVGVCIYQFSDNFMTLFRTELAGLPGKTWIQQREYHHSGWRRMTRLPSPARSMLSSLMALTF